MRRTSDFEGIMFQWDNVSISVGKYLFIVSFSPSKEIVLFVSMKALKNDKKCFLFHVN